MSKVLLLVLVVMGMVGMTDAVGHGGHGGGGVGEAEAAFDDEEGAGCEPDGDVEADAAVRLRVIRVVRMMARMLELGMVKMMCQRPVFGMCSNTLCVPAPPPFPPSGLSGPGGLSPPVTRAQTQRCPLGLLPAHDHPSTAEAKRPGHIFRLCWRPRWSGPRC